VGRLEGHIRLEDVTYGYEEGKEVLESVTLDIGKGKKFALVGPSGGGKTTICHLIPNFYKVESGRILLDGQDITDKNITERAKAGISFAFQQPVRFKGIQVLDLIRLAAGRRMSPADACQYLAEVGLCAKDYINREVNASLAGGELKRIEIATVLARSTRLSVFDEPEAGIDLWSFQNLIQVFEKMRKKIHDSSIMIISHQERILEIADEIVVLRSGRIAATGSREEILPTLIGTPSAVEACKVLTSK
jgi:Fe-S cluster assembly ATP-binding protein